MLHLFISSFFTIILYSLSGSLISNNIKSNTINYSKNIINGIILISFISLSLNFFTALTKKLTPYYFFNIFLIFFLNLTFLNQKNI